MPATEATTTLHRALGDERRARIVRELESTETALDAEALAQRVGLHVNTVRWHLGILAGAGIVRSFAAPRQTPGRPRINYELVPSATRSSPDEYRLLATVLAGIVSGSEDGAAVSEIAGRAWGRALVQRPEPRVAVEEDEAIARVVDVLAEQGFRPRVQGQRIEMHRCPFHDLAETCTAVVCGVHRGMISGALAELGQRSVVTELEIFPRPDVCVAHLGAPSTTP